MIYDCVVIGAGLSGLISSIILSKNGVKTALVEKCSKTGPLVRGFKRQGYYFDTGFHHAGGIGEGSSGRLMIDYLDVCGLLNLIPGDPECSDIIRFKDSSFEFRFPAGYERIKERLFKAFPHDKHAIEEYLNEINRRCKLLPFLNLDADFRAMNILENVHGASLEKYLSDLTDNQCLKSILSSHCLLNGVPSFEQGLNNYAYIVGPYYESVSYIEGGGSALIDAFEKAAEKNGVDLFTGSEAGEIHFSASGSLDGVVLADNSIVNCRNCISTIHPQDILKLIPEKRFRRSYVKRINLLEETPSAFILYGISRADLKSMFGANLYLLPDSKDNSGDHEKPVENRPVNLIIDRSQKIENQKGEGFIAILPASIKEVDEWRYSTRGNRPPEYLDFKEKFMKRMISHIESFCPELEGNIEAVDCSTPLTLRDYSGSPFGSMYGAKHRVEQYNPFPTTTIPGLFLAGQSIVAPGLLGTMISAFLACGNILGHDFIRGELKRWS